MPTKLTNYQCPSCGGPLRYDGVTEKLECDYCGSSFIPAEVEKYYRDKLEQAEQAAAADMAAEAEAAEASSWQTGEESWEEAGEDMRLYQCPSCGAQLACDKTTAATSCPYCGNPTVVPGQFHGQLKPDYILPFRITKEEAVAALKGYYKGKKLLPRRFSEQNHLEEIKGVYVPFWLFDGRVSADMSYTGTRVHTTVTGKEQITVTEYYDVARAGRVDFMRIPADGSSKMPDELMDSIEPYDYRELRPFSTAYMPGFLADIYDVNADACYERIEQRAVRTAEKLVDSTVSGYDSLTTKSRQVNLRKGRVSYAMLPVWMLSTRWNGKNFLFAMNGQTGKFIGDLPVSVGKYLLWFAGVSLPLAAILGFLLG
ncbi:MAG: hypothetical protein K6C08_08275 [Oscillospiraceae bacterium]|nr:hypothetical protein [Oscillospiraceae bacterium]